jgi:predicted phage tail protein
MTAITFSWVEPYDGGNEISSYQIQSNMGEGSTFI